MSVEITGREEEFRRLGAFLDSAPREARTLVLEGEAGIGKSTLWTAAVEAARERGMRVLAAEPAEAERSLGFAGLDDLFEGVLDRVLPLLAPPRRRALEVALLLETSSDGFDPRAAGVAVRNVLEIFAGDGPIVLAIDDVQWLDPSSSGALAFALRRIREHSVLVLLARRVGAGAEESELEDAIGAERVERLRLGQLSLGAIHRLLQARLGAPLPRPLVVRIHETSGGNPFYAIELARALGTDVDPTQPLAVPETLEGLLRARFDGLPEATRKALAFVSALGKPSDGLLEASAITQEMLEPALAAHVIERGTA